MTAAPILNALAALLFSVRRSLPRFLSIRSGPNEPKRSSYRNPGHRADCDFSQHTAEVARIIALPPVPKAQRRKMWNRYQMIPS